MHLRDVVMSSQSASSLHLHLINKIILPILSLNVVVLVLEVEVAVLEEEE